MSEYLELYFGKIAISHHDRKNSNPTIVFLHDSWGCIEMWGDFPEKLGEATNCSVLVYDRFGYGKSDPFIYPKRGLDYLDKEVVMLKQVLTALGIERPVLFGHSDGGSIALLAAAKYPDAFRGIITEGAHVFVDDVSISGLKFALARYESGDLRPKLLKYHGDKTDDMFYAWVSTWLSEEFKAWNIEDRLPNIVCPSLIIQGEHDEYGSYEQVERILQKVCGPRKQLRVPFCGHTPHRESPEETLMAGTYFIKELIDAH